MSVCRDSPVRMEVCVVTITTDIPATVLELAFKVREQRGFHCNKQVNDM